MRSFPRNRVPIGRFSALMVRHASKNRKLSMRSTIYRNIRRAGIKIRKGFTNLPTAAFFKCDVDLSHTNPFEAIRHEDLQELLDTFIAGSDLTKADEKGNTPLHLACEVNDRCSARMLMTLHAEFQPWLTPNAEGVRPLDIAKGEILADINLLMTPTTQPPNEFDRIRAINEQHMSTVISQAEKRPPRILVGVDGGGVKGVALLLAIRELDLHTRSLGTGAPVHYLPALDRSPAVSILPGNSPPFLHSMVDWMGCTSVGAIVGANISYESLRMPYNSTCEGIRTFLASTSQIFGTKANNQQKRSDALLEQMTGIYDKRKLKEIKYKFFMNTTCCKELPARTILLRNYHPDIPTAVELGYEDRRDMEIANAIMATAAAPVFFNAYEGLSDGGVIMKNPTMELMKEFHNWQMIERQRGIANNDAPGLILSLGTGRTDPKPISGIDYRGRRNYMSKEFVKTSKNLLDVFMMQSTTAESYNIPHTEAWAQSIGAPYYRINPRFESPMLMSSMDVYVLNDFMWEVMVYVRTHIHDDLRRIAKHLADIQNAR